MLELTFISGISGAVSVLETFHVSVDVVRYE